MKSKPIATSKTIVINLVALVVGLIALWGLEVDAEIQAAIVTVASPLVNIALRFVTKQPVTLT